MKLDLSGLENRVFDALAQTSDRRYIYMTNFRTGVTRWSQNAVEYFGLPGEFFADGAAVWEAVVHPDDRKAFNDDIQAVFAGTKKMHDAEYRARNKDGDYVMCRCRGIMLKDDAGNLDLFVGTLDNHGLIDNVDPITNLYNAYEFVHELRSNRHQNVKSLVLIIGINDFTNINTIYDYVVGNQILHDFAENIRLLLKENGNGMVFRLDGVKFGICLREGGEAEAEKLYAQIRDIASHKIYVGGRQIPLGLSAGAVVVRHCNSDEKSIQACALYALRVSKRERLGELTYFNNEQADSTRQDMKLIVDMQKSIVNNCDGFYLCYQPIVYADSSKIVGMEALLRWKKEPYGEVSPGRFIPWLENDTHFYELGKWILRQALKDVAVIQKEHPDFFVNVNVAYTQMERTGFRDTVLEILNEMKLPPSCLHLELTERCQSLQLDYLREEMSFFRSKGIRMVLDDFGMEGSSLDLLRNLPIDYLKIDRSFVSQIESDSVQQAIVESVLQCAEKLGIKTCIEGIETDPMREFLLHYPAEYHQGYLYSRPIQLDGFRKLMNNSATNN